MMVDSLWQYSEQLSAAQVPKTKRGGTHATPVSNHNQTYSVTNVITHTPQPSLPSLKYILR